MKSYTRIRARIDLDAIEYNIEKMKENLPEDTKLIVVAKADCYGHGGFANYKSSLVERICVGICSSYAG